jgi:prepilin signal peptidase PulO-like enzyme (type II secretory pathway)
MVGATTSTTDAAPIYRLRAGGVAFAAIAVVSVVLLPVRFAVLAILLVPIAWVDRKHGTIPDLFLVAGLIAAAVLMAASIPMTSIPLIEWVAPAVRGLPLFVMVVVWGCVAAGFAWSVRLAGFAMCGEAGMGMGDVKLAFVMGCMVGPLALATFYLAICLAGVRGVIALASVRGGKGNIPFAPYLLYASFLTPFVAEKVVRWMA